MSSVIFHPRQEIIISNSEDKTIRVWDIQKRTAIHTFRRENDRFWVMAAHPEMNLFAAGHDSGLMVFKLERERPSFTIHQNSLYYVKDKIIRMYDFTDGKDSALLSLKHTPGPASAIKTISYNPAENCVVIASIADDGSYERHELPRDSHSNVAPGVKGPGHSALFISRNRFAVLDKTLNQLLIKDSRNETTKQIKFPPTQITTDMFYAGRNTLLLTTAAAVLLYDTELRIVTAELPMTNARYVSWSPDMSHVALMSKHTLIIASKKLVQLCSVYETIKIKSGAWDEIGIFVYSTLNHLKFALPKGCAISSPVWWFYYD